MKAARQKDAVQFRVLRYLENRPQASQRDISNDLKISLGSVNYSIKALVEKGCIKLERFRSSSNKGRYLYVLTPTGVARRAKLALAFFELKMVEFEQARAEIEALKREFQIDPGD